MSGLVINSLVHRDLDSWSDGLAVEVRLKNDQLMITNPGGLYEITVDRLGQDHVTSAGNARLASLCQDIKRLVSLVDLARWINPIVGDGSTTTGASTSPSWFCSFGASTSIWCIGLDTSTNDDAEALSEPGKLWLLFIVLTLIGLLIGVASQA